MTLTTHAIVGATFASIFPQDPALALSAAFASHFLIDTLPHWDYAVLSKIEGETKIQSRFDTKSPLYLLDFLRTGSDAVLGTILSVLILSMYLFHFPLWVSVLGAWAGVLPDFLQFVYYKTRTTFLLPLQRFHIWIQKGRSIYPSPFVGLLLQAMLVVIVLALRTLF
jgi:hypothetical protein